MKILTDIDRAFCAFGSTVPLYDCTNKQKIFYSRKITNTTLNFQRFGRQRIKHEFEQMHTVEVCIRIPDVEPCTDQVELEQKRCEELEPALSELRLLISSLVMLGYEMQTNSRLSVDITPATSHLNIGAKLVATFADCTAYKCNLQRIDKEKLGVPIPWQEGLNKSND